MEVDEPVVSPSSSSSSSEGDSEEANKLLTLIKETESNLALNPYYYDTHVQLIKLYRQAGDLDGARQARTNMADKFPLDESLWLEWIRDESSLVSVPSAVQDLTQLYERAVQDFLSVQIWLEYVQFSMDVMSDGFDYPREIYEKAIIAVGLHTSQGSLIWNSYKDFEKAILQSLQEVQSNNPEDNEFKRQVEAQYSRVDGLYKRQLSVPLIGHEETFEEYQSFNDASSITKESLPNYARALKRLQVLLPYEQQILESEQSSSDLYQNYVNKLIEVKEESTLINTVFQRGIASNPLSTNLWDLYLEFLDKEFTNIKSVLLKGHELSVRTCPWVVRYWIKYTQTLERMKEPHEKIVNTYENAVGDNFENGSDYLQIWTAYCDYLHRQTHQDDSKEEKREAVRSVFSKAKEHLTKFHKPVDLCDTLSRYQASLEARCYGNMAEARTLWSDVMKRHGNQSQYWLEYIELERVYGDLSNCRKLFMMSINSVSDDPELVCTSFLQFEREQGTLESFLIAERKCAAQLERIKERREKALESVNDKRSNENKKNRKGANKTEQKQKVEQKESPGGGGGRKKRKMEGHVFYTEEEHKSKVMKMENASTTTEAVTVSDSSDVTSGVRETKVSQVESQSKKPQSTGIAEHTVFVSNLSFNTTREVLEETFSQCGEIHDVRLIKKTQGGGRRLNTYAYVEYKSTEPISKALLMNRSQLNQFDRPIYVSICKSSNTNSGSDSTEKLNKYNDKATVFVTNIAHDVTEKQLEELFQEAGEIKGVRLVRNRQGRSKGYAYIEYVSESSVKGAILSLDGREMMGKGIKVALSNPPKSQPVAPPRFSESIVSMEMDIPNTRKPLSSGPKTNLSLVPRALARKKPAVTDDSNDNKHDDTLLPQKKSNEDFRQLLFKK